MTASWPPPLRQLEWWEHSTFTQSSWRLKTPLDIQAKMSMNLGQAKTDFLSLMGNKPTLSEATETRVWNVSPARKLPGGLMSLLCNHENSQSSVIWPPHPVRKMSGNSRLISADLPQKTGEKGEVQEDTKDCRTHTCTFTYIIPWLYNN